MKQTVIPGFSDKHPPLGRLEQLVNDAQLHDTIIGPTDHNFIQLLALRAPLERAAAYVSANQLERLKELDERRNRKAARAFQMAQLPAALIDFQLKAHKHNLLDDETQDGHTDRYKIKLGGWRGFAITYKDGPDNTTSVCVQASRLFGKCVMLAFSHQPQTTAQGKRFELINADAQLLKRSDELTDLLDDTIKGVEEAKLRQHVRQHIRQRYY